MQRELTPEIRENASAAPDFGDRLVDCECKLIALKSMTEALSDLLSGPLDKDFSPARRRLNAAYQVACSVEDLAEEAKELVQDERLIALRHQHRADKTAVVAGTELFQCSHDDMVDFVDSLLPLVDMLKVMQVALESSDPFDAYGPKVFASNAGTVITEVERLLENMRSCFNRQSGRRHDRAAEAGAA